MCSGLWPYLFCAEGLKPAASSAADFSDDSSDGDVDDEPVIGQSKPMGFKINLGGVAANEVDDKKPVALPHTPRDEVVAKLKPAASSAFLMRESSVSTCTRALREARRSENAERPTSRTTSSRPEKAT